MHNNHNNNDDNNNNNCLKKSYTECYPDITLSQKLELCYASHKT